MNFFKQKYPSKIFILFVSLAVILTLLFVIIRFPIVANDFRTFYEVGIFAQNGQNIYSSTPTTGMKVFYLPYFSLIMGVFALLPFIVASIVWCLSKLFFYIFMYRKSFDLIGVKANGVLICIPFVILISSIRNEFSLGQVNAFVLMFLFLTFISLNAKKEWQAAFYFTLSAVKVIPLAMLFLFFLKRQWSFLIKIGTLFCLWMVSLLMWFGHAKFFTLFQNFYEVSRSEKLNITELAWQGNQSLQGAVARIARDVYPNLLHPVANNIDLSWFKLITYACLGVLLVPIVLFRNKRMPNKISLAEYSIMITWFLLASPDTRGAHFVILMIPLFGIVQYLYATNYKDTFSKIVLGVLFIIFVLVNRDLIGTKNFTIVREFSVQTCGMILIYISLIRILIKTQNQQILTARTG